ncbi:hypothetical protein [Brevibacterium aurantiacum]|uniref:Uncharacterized protein n=1 Tax=Brevibacterium aurantiacum TaxID=273384 RepID=A0A2A3Z5N3_BREAU|nr:hypothetical protein [Brevibacterium aurantiacum]AOP53257.1 hypothetical protein BLSMQ_1547 [Brevibacterium aurantiacum]AZT93161.1 hypothetical protein CXR23_08370 [Brevibacterium aurantiacum]PCC46828.1 hypothetical protein CIK64_08195 [Brevibacterium aurantiacum]PCC53042.1 hypothetical protein CIK59_12990 [Brevibacterium aurantiacum]RCS96815.1 hypothetical protein CIK60_13805 [Brevibacterium aurantiacum]
MILAAAQDATPSGAPDPDLVTPGTIGFLSTLVIVIVVIFLIRDALRRVRRVRARAQADDAYPIPMRKYAVPNQSKLSGDSAPAADDETSTTAKTDASPTTTTDAEKPEQGESARSQD